ncbi:MAG: hypothetical protein ACD_11C00072G0012 [uncultured bacterium]|nr:MAG: hypothetical protein ACD_11C00072G0012 [uncultured bacterium]HBR71776.1 hypothetical protein [Candidatus Moranbacteria bacterium]
MKINLGTGIKNINLKDIWSSLWLKWRKNYKIFFGLFFCAVLIFGAYVWYRSLYQSAWDEQKRSEYEATKNNSVVFKENIFESSLEISRKRKEEFEKPSNSIRDIFKKY